MRIEQPPEFVNPLVIEFPLDGQDVKVTAANVQQLEAMMSALRPALAELLQLPRDVLARAFSDEGPTQQDVLLLMDVLSLHAGMPAKLVAIAMGWPIDKVQKLLPDRMAYLFAVLLQVNADFFGRARHVLDAALGKLSDLVPEFAGLLPTPSASGPSASTS